MEEHETFHIGVNVFAIKDKHLLLGKRKNAHGAGSWGLPGGHLEIKESMKDAAARELMEETGMSAEKYTFTNIVNDRSSGKHYVQVGFIAEGMKGDPVLREPDMCEEWKWFDINKLPKELFPPHIEQINNFLKGSGFADA